MVRERTDAGIVMLTARDALADRVRGLDGGADDYVVKPFLLAELVSRVRAVLRRRGREAAAIQLGDLLLDDDANAVSRGGKLLDLTATELRLLRYLVAQRNRTVSKPPRSSPPCGGTTPTTPTSSRLYISSLRRKLGDPKLLHTVRGLGYVPQGRAVTATPSLRRRVTLTVLGLFAILLVLVGVLVDVALGAQLARDLNSRLSDRVSRAEQLADQGASPPQLVSQLQGQDIRVRVVTADGDSYGDPGLGPLGPGDAARVPVTPKPPTPPVESVPGDARAGAPGPPTPPDKTSTTVTKVLSDGNTVVLGRLTPPRSPTSAASSAWSWPSPRLRRSSWRRWCCWAGSRPRCGRWTG